MSDHKTHFMTDKPIMLIGLMGSGKTVIGRLLSNATGLPFCDSDKVIEDQSGLRIGDIFDLYGEAKFREMERRTIAELLTHGPQILSVGGGAFCQREIREAAKDTALVIWLRATAETLLSRMDNLSTRPLLAGDNPLGVLQNLHQQRYDDYAKADMVIDTDGLSQKQSLELVLTQLDTYQANTAS
ncbi:MAG: shikimate kinase [Candidatus Puniceispirillaceae bacterium]